MAQSVAFPSFSFWSLAVCKNGGGRPGPFYHVDDVSVYLGRQRGGGVPHRKNELEALSCSFCPKRWSFERSRSEKRTASGSKRRTRNAFIRWGIPPSLCLPIGRHWRHSRDKMDQAFPLRFCILQTMDGGKGWERGYVRSLFNSK